jgi:hypothetical protein
MLVSVALLWALASLLLMRQACRCCCRRVLLLLLFLQSLLLDLPGCLPTGSKCTHCKRQGINMT